MVCVPDVHTKPAALGQRLQTFPAFPAPRHNLAPCPLGPLWADWAWLLMSGMSTWHDFKSYADSVGQRSA
jgi:hypothetical protein